MTGIVQDQYRLEDHENNHIPLNSNDQSNENISLPLNDPSPRNTNEGETPINDNPNVLTEANYLPEDTSVSNAVSLTTIATTTSQYENRSPTLIPSVANYESDSADMEIDDVGGNNKGTSKNDGDGDAEELGTNEPRSPVAASATVGDVTVGQLDHKSDETIHKDDGLSQEKTQSSNSSNAQKLDDKLVELAEKVQCSESSRAEEEDEEEMPLQRLVENEGNCKPVLSPPIPISNIQGIHRDLTAFAVARNQKRPIVSDTKPAGEYANPNPPIEMPIGTMPQFCIFCPASFKKNEDYEVHIVLCNPVLAKMTNFRKRKCLVCNRTIRQFNVTGLLRHSISCIIMDRSNRLTSEAAALDKAQKEAEVKVKNNVEEQSNEITTQSDIPKDNDAKLTAGGSSIGRSSHVQRNPQSNSQSIYTQEQEEGLEHFFLTEQFPTPKQLTLLSKQTGLIYAQVKEWFERKRYRMNLDGTQPTTSSHSIRHSNKSQSGIASCKYSAQNITILTTFFKRNMHPSTTEVSALARKTKLRSRDINHWFQISRSKIQIREHQHKKLQSPASSASPSTSNQLLNEDSGDDDNDEEMSSRSSMEEGATINNKSTIKPVQSFSELSSSLQSIMMEAFKRTPKPAVLDVIHLSQKTGLSTSGVTAWFAKQRKASSSYGYQNNSPSVLSGNNDGYATKNYDFDEQEEQYHPGNNVKLMTSRQKLAAIKKITCQEIKGILTERKSVIVQILLLFAASGSSIQQALEFECMNLAEALETNNPFTPSQTTYFGEWEDDFVIGMYPEKNDPGWIRAVDAFREKILKNWSRVLVFAKFTQCSLQEAAITILKLTLTRGQKDIDVQWEMLHLFSQLETTVTYNYPDELYDIDSSD